MLRLHFCAGVLVAPFLPTAAVTGLLYAGSFRTERLVHGHEPTVPADERELPASVQVAAARKARPEGTAAAVRLVPALAAVPLPGWSVPLPGIPLACLLAADVLLAVGILLGEIAHRCGRRT
ncbi:hypothetical protein GCM10010300_41380 [Streptomyces olivaceoviridis]|uniref:PepSY domain-containing protein n=1 Tax=Streptomyces olivaceoviridis TaxID=1921 RepID=UPI001678D7CD|nr:hypothetical protein GCM10010300_41380 [Streptomyces olivaceoviridis]